MEKLKLQELKYLRGSRTRAFITNSKNASGWGLFPLMKISGSIEAGSIFWLRNHVTEFPLMKISGSIEAPKIKLFN